MRPVSYEVMMTLTIDAILIPLIGIGNVVCVTLALIVMNAITMNCNNMTLLMYTNLLKV